MNNSQFIFSVAILRYLAKKYEGQISSNWYPNDPKAQAKVDEYLEWQHLNTRLNCAMFFQHKVCQATIFIKLFEDTRYISHKYIFIKLVLW